LAVNWKILGSTGLINEISDFWLLAEVISAIAQGAHRLCDWII